jgi:hypothetical protein
MKPDNALLSHYKGHRQVCASLNMELVELLDKSDLHGAAKDLGLLQRGAMVFESKAAIPVLMDYALHGFRSRKKPPLVRYREQHLLAPQSEKALVLDALADSRYSVFQVMGSEAGYLCQCKEVFTGQDLTLVDHGLASTAAKGLLVASWVMRIPGSDCFMTTGAPIPITQPTSIVEIKKIVLKFLPLCDECGLAPSRQASLSRQITRILLRSGDLDRITYPEE